ncbi:hypothetical protein QUF75_09345 [Desulfococcaceae bacterium HSG7]|nr:hypothetical protein [Desulfococcaceae bacterium HSG7]
MTTTSELQRRVDKLKELEDRYDMKSENIDALIADYENPALTHREKLHIKREIDTEEYKRDELGKDMGLLENEIEQTKFQNQQKTFHLLFEELLRLNCTNQLRQFNTFIDRYKIGTFMIHGDGEFGFRFLLKRIANHLRLKTGAESDFVPINLSSSSDKIQELEKRSEPNLNPLLQSIGKKWKCSSSLEEIVKIINEKLKKHNVVLKVDIRDKMGLSSSLKDLIKNDWNNLSKKIEDSIAPRTDNLFLFLLVFNDKYFKNFPNFSNISEYHKSYCQQLDAFFEECEIEFVNKCDTSWSPNIPVRLPIIDRFCKEDLDKWIPSFCDMFPQYDSHCGPETVKEILNMSADGYPDLVIEHIVVKLCNIKFKRGDLEEELIKWLKI